MNMFRSTTFGKPKLSKFDLSHERKLSCNMGELIPILLQEVVPGDNFRVNSEIMMRLAPLLTPIMHRVDVWTHYFFVPNRIIWDEWQDFITGGRQGTTEPVHPYVTLPGNEGYFGNGNIADFFGLPTTAGAFPADGTKVSALPFRAYTQIWSEYYRDQNLQEEVEFSKASGEVTGGELDLIMNGRYRAWEKDYFTSALPWTQRGDEVIIPVGGTFTPQYRSVSDVKNSDGTASGANTLGSDASGVLEDKSTFAKKAIHNLVTPQEVDALGISINDLRESNAIQRFLEAMARGGARYTEYLKSIYGVTVPDSTLQRPQYLGGGRQRVSISEVLQTSETLSGTPQGNMAGHGVAVGNTNRFQKRFVEHGFVLGIMSVLPRTAYQQGINKMWLRNDRFDYFTPHLAHLGEQEVVNKEVYYATGATGVDDVFGYQSRNAEYKYQPSTVHGDFRSSLDYWHMGRIFGSQPALNEEFIQSNPTHRVFANTDPNVHKLWVQIYNKIDALRPMPYFGVPKL